MAVTTYGDSRFNAITNDQLPPYSFLTIETLKRFGIDFMSGVVSASGLMQNVGGREDFEVIKDERKFFVLFRQYESSGTKYVGCCVDLANNLYDYVQKSDVGSTEECFQYCESLDLESQVGLCFRRTSRLCSCNYDNDGLPSDTKGGFSQNGFSGVGPVASGSGGNGECYPRKVRL